MPGGKELWNGSNSTGHALRGIQGQRIYRIARQEAPGERHQRHRGLSRQAHQLGPVQLAVAPHFCHQLLRHRVRKPRRRTLRHGSLRMGSRPFVATPGRLHHGGRHHRPPHGARAATPLRPDGRAQVRHSLRRLRHQRRSFPQQLPRGARRRPDYPRRRLSPRLPPAPRSHDIQHHAALAQSQGRALLRRRQPQAEAAGLPARASRRRHR